jgi:hypothetical protein
VRDLASWGDLARVALALLPASAVLLVPEWTAVLGLSGVAFATLAFLITFLAALLLLRLPEAVHAARRIHGPLGAET